MNGGGGISEAEQNQKACRPQEPHPRQVNTLTRRNEPRYHVKSNGRPFSYFSSCLTLFLEKARTVALESLILYVVGER